MLLISIKHIFTKFQIFFLSVEGNIYIQVKRKYCKQYKQQFIDTELLLYHSYFSFTMFSSTGMHFFHSVSSLLLLLKIKIQLSEFYFYFSYVSILLLTVEVSLSIYVCLQQFSNIYQSLAQEYFIILLHFLISLSRKFTQFL